MAAPRGNTGYGCYFITASTFQKRNLLQSDRIASLLGSSIFPPFASWGLTNLCLPYQIEAAPLFAGFEGWVPQHDPRSQPWWDTFEATFIVPSTRLSERWAGPRGEAPSKGDSRSCLPPIERRDGRAASAVARVDSDRGDGSALLKEDSPLLTNTF